jgi:hypothetical protein
VADDLKGDDRAAPTGSPRGEAGAATSGVQQPGRSNGPESTHASRASDWRTLVPTWVQAVAAVAAVVVAVATLVVTADQLNSDSKVPVVTVTGMSSGPNGLAVGGTYQQLRPAEQTLFVIAKPVEDAAGDWIPVRARLHPTLMREAGVEDGEWDANVPLPSEVRYRVAPVILAGSFADGATSGALDDLKSRGPNADGVVATAPETSTP